MTSPARIGIYGGTFNPPHLGHLIVAEEIRQRFCLEKVMFIPSARPPHKTDSPVIDSADRYEMTALATRDNPHFDISDIEIRRSGKSYTIDTIKELKKIYGPEVDIFFIMGGDSIFEIETWKEPDKLLNLCKVVVTTRPGFDLKGIEERLREKIIVAEVSHIGISSTEIRRRVQEGKSIRYLVPRQVEEYIVEEKLYQQGAGQDPVVACESL